MERELSYHVPFERLMKLSRTMGRKAFRGSWLVTASWIGAFLVAMACGPLIERQFEGMGLPKGSEVVALLVVFFAGLLVIRSWRLREAKSRADYDAEATLRQDAGGVRIASNSIEYYVKWAGIAQLLVEPDGLVISHGSLFFFVPNSAFTSLDERDAFAGEIFSKLGPAAKDRSIAHLPPAVVVSARGA